MSIMDPLKQVQRLRRAHERRERDTGQDRLPPGQVITSKFPVLHHGGIPQIDLETWRLEVWALVEEPREFTWEELMQLPRQRQVCDIHCVTRWSKLDTVWEGIPGSMRGPSTDCWGDSSNPCRKSNRQVKTWAIEEHFATHKEKNDENSGSESVKLKCRGFQERAGLAGLLS